MCPVLPCRQSVTDVKATIEASELPDEAKPALLDDLDKASTALGMVEAYDGAVNVGQYADEVWLGVWVGCGW